MTDEPGSKLSPAERVTRAIIAMLERGVRPWLCPWDANLSGGLLPLRATGQAYRGANVVALWAVAAARGYASPYWLSFKQALALGGAVRKGERGASVVFYKELPKPSGDANEDDVNDKLRPRRLLRCYTVFNLAQTEGLNHHFSDPPDAAASIDGAKSDRFEGSFARVPAEVRWGGARAYYSPASDHVQMPPKGAFADVETYYATLAHELGHWTRHPSRLDRDFGQARFGDRGYAMEELVAELCAAFVGAVIGLRPDHLEDHAAYISTWLDVLSQDANALLAAAAKAQAAADYLLHLMGESELGAAPED